VTEPVSSGTRRQLKQFASSRRTRRVQFSDEAPCDWGPLSLTDPRTGQAFTEDGAWEFICDSIQAGVPINEVELHHPPGKKGYELLLQGFGGVTLYVKLQIMGDHVRGRSFHQSYKN